MRSLIYRDMIPIYNPIYNMYIERERGRESGNDESDFQEQDGVLPIDQDFSDFRGLSPMVLDGFGVLSVAPGLRRCASKCASRHNGVHFFDISTSKSGPTMVCFGQWCVLYILTSKCASRHNGVHFFMSDLASWLRTRRFSEPTFRPSEHSVSRLSYLFTHLHLLSSESFSSLIFSLLLSSSLCLCPALLFICPYCRKFDF